MGRYNIHCMYGKMQKKGTEQRICQGKRYTYTAYTQCVLHSKPEMLKQRQRQMQKQKIETSENVPLANASEHHAPYTTIYSNVPTHWKERAIFFLRSFDARSCWYFYIYAFALSFWRCVKMKRKNNNNTYLRSFITAISVFNLPHYLRLTFIVFIVVAISSRRRRQQRRQQQQQPE